MKLLKSHMMMVFESITLMLEFLVKGVGPEDALLVEFEGFVTLPVFFDTSIPGLMN